MKKYFTLAFTVMLFINCSDNKKETEALKSDLESYKLQGDVLNVSEKSFKIENGKEIPGSEIASAHNTDLEFDENGALISVKQWMANGKPYEQESYKGKSALIKRTQFIEGNPNIITDNQWDEEGKNILATIRHNPDNSPIDKTTYTFKDNKLTEKTIYNGEGTPIDKITYTYDKAGNIKKEEFFQGNGVLKAYAVCNYDFAKNKTSESRFNANKSLQYKTDYTYKNNKVATKITSDSNGKKSSSETITYDSKGNIIKRTKWEQFENAESVESYVYDNNNNVLNWSTMTNNKVQLSTVYTYDKNNNVLTYKLSGAEGIAPLNKTYAYTYDAHNNWIEKKITVNEVPAYTVKRIIKYQG